MTNPIRRMADKASERNRIMESWMAGYGTGSSNGGSGAPDHWSPATDVMMREDGGLVIVMDLPGVRREDIEVSLTGGDLTVSGHKEGRGEGSQYFTSERYSGPFQRTVGLSEGLTRDRISCHFEKGTLEITVQGYADTLEAESQRLEVLGPRD